MNSESQNIEYKESWRDEYLKWICGFANAQGGKIYIGVNDNREVVGVDDSPKHSSNPRNNLIACAFYLLGYIENWGLGYKKIMEGFKTAGLKLPTIELVDGGVGVTVWRQNVTENVTENVATLSKLFKVSERTIKRDLAKLQTLGVVRRDGPDKGGKWVVLYER